jgi:hypothetical protein
LLVDDCLLVELKAIQDVAPIHKAQLLSYMKLLNVPCRWGFCSTSTRSSSSTGSQGLSCPVQTSIEQKETKTTKSVSRGLSADNARKDRQYARRTHSIVHPICMPTHRMDEQSVRPDPVIDTVFEDFSECPPLGSSQDPRSMDRL